MTRSAMCCLCLCLIGSMCAPALAQKKAPDGAKVLLLSGGQRQHHGYRDQAFYLAAELEDTGRYEVTLTEEAAVLDTPALAKYDLVVAIADRRDPEFKLSKSQQLALVAFVQSGKGYVSIHGADNAPADWEPEFKLMLGGVFSHFGLPDGKTRKGEYTVRIVDPNNPVGKGIADFSIEDELYYHLQMAPGVQPFAVVEFQGEDWPVAWTQSVGKGRVFHTTFGHRDFGPDKDDPLRNPGFHRLVLQGIAWAANHGASPVSSARPEREPKAGSEQRQYPVMAWDYADDERTLKAMADCGVNLVAFVPEPALDICARLGLKAIVYDPRITPARWNDLFDGKKVVEALPDLIRRVNDHPAVAGYHLKDEPGADQYAELGKAVKAVRELAPGKWPYVNLLPGMGADYDKYLDEFVRQCNPTALSYDNYPLPQNAGFSYGYWANMAQVRNAGIRHELPFWTIMLSVAHWGYDLVTPVTLRLQAFGALAYGAQGICYYKFISRELPILDAPDLGNWRGAPLDEYLEKTPTWTFMRTMNREIQNVGPTLLKLRSDLVYHVGEVPAQNRGIGEDTLVKRMAAGDAFVIGDFTHREDGSRWVMIVNKDLKSSFPCLPEYRAAVAKVEYVSPITGKLKTFPHPYYYLAPGQGVLLKLTTKTPPAS